MRKDNSIIIREIKTQREAISWMNCYICYNVKILPMIEKNEWSFDHVIIEIVPNSET